MELLFSIYNKATFERQILSGIYHLKSLQIVFQLKSVKVKREKAFNNTPWQVYEQKKKMRAMESPNDRGEGISIVIWS